MTSSLLANVALCHRYWIRIPSSVMSSPSGTLRCEQLREVHRTRTDGLSANAGEAFLDGRFLRERDNGRTRSVPGHPAAYRPGPPPRRRMTRHSPERFRRSWGTHDQEIGKTCDARDRYEVALRVIVESRIEERVGHVIPAVTMRSCESSACPLATCVTAMMLPFAQAHSRRRPAHARKRSGKTVGLLGQALRYWFENYSLDTDLRELRERTG